MTTPPQSPLSRTAAWALALVATLTMAVSYIDRQTLSAIAPSVQKALHIDDTQYGLLGSAFAFAYLVGAPLAGRLIDGVGARRGLLGAVLVWSLVAALHAVVPGFGVLFAMRVCLGIAEAPSFPAAAQTIQRVLPPADRARGFGILFTGSSVGAAAANRIVPWLDHRYGFRVAFLCTAAAGLVWVPLWLGLAFRPEARAVLDRAVVRAAATPRGPTSLVLLRHPAVLRCVVAVLASAPLLTFMFQWATKYLVHDHGLTQLQAGELLWLPPLFFDLGAIAFGHRASVARARGANGVPRPHVALASAAMLAGVAIPFAPTPALAVAAMCVMAMGGGGMYALPMSDMAARIPPGVVATAGGLGAAAQSVAQIVTNIAIGVSLKHTGTYTLILVALGIWVVPGAALWLASSPPPLHVDEPAA